ncbi:MAG: hypothetical protein K6B65_04125 [Bacilli bacterium]|nr:hypothetical protein [Bacilli bacterium]
MASKLGLLLSSVFMIFVMLTVGDLMCLSTIRSGLDSLAVTVGYRLAKDGYYSPSTETLITKYGATFKAITKSAPRVGDTYEFALSKEYKPLFMSKNTMVITVTHATIVGFYDSYY